MTEPIQARARLFGPGGEEKDVSDLIIGGDEYFSAWKTDVDTPSLQQASGWQRTDEEHPPESGKPAYRVVYKTLRMIPFPSAKLEWDNLRVYFSCGDVERGGIRFDDTIPGRRQDQSIIPEYGRVLENDYGQARYLNCPSMHFSISGWEDTIKAVSSIEIIWVAEGSYTDPRDLIDAGRDAVGPLLTMLEFEFGPRLLSTQLTEEAGETFPDWHWSRHIFTGTVYAESQASLVHQAGHQFLERLSLILERQQDFSPVERERLRLASRWYWIAQKETDKSLLFLQWWLIVETLEMPDTTNIAPISGRLSKLMEVDSTVFKEIVGRLFGLRSRVVHGEVRDVPKDQSEALEIIARLLLASRAGVVKEEEYKPVRELFKLPAKN